VAKSAAVKVDTNRSFETASTRRSVELESDSAPHFLGLNCPLFRRQVRIE
jgi:hypothetical protein